MFDHYRSNRGQLYGLAVAYAVVGAVLLIRPELVLDIISYVIGALLIAFGVLRVLGGMKERNTRVFSIILGMAVALFGILSIVNTKIVVSSLPYICGVLLLIDGLYNIRHSAALKRYGASGSMAALVLGIFTLVLGIVIAFRPYSAAKFTFRLIGAALLYSGISDFFILHGMNRAVRRYDREHRKKRNHDGVIDVQACPVDDDEED